MANFEPTEAQVDNLIGLLDGYAEKGGHHLNVNVLNRETLLDAQAHREVSTAHYQSFRLRCKLRKAY